MIESALIMVSEFRIISVVTQVADPWGGSYMMENLTYEIYKAALKVIMEVRLVSSSGVFW